MPSGQNSARLLLDNDILAVLEVVDAGPEPRGLSTSGLVSWQVQGGQGGMPTVSG
jgi:hypothetical protein